MDLPIRVEDHNVGTSKESSADDDKFTRPEYKRYTRLDDAFSAIPVSCVPCLSLVLLNSVATLTMLHVLINCGRALHLRIGQGATKQENRLVFNPRRMQVSTAQGSRESGPERSSRCLQPGAAGSIEISSAARNLMLRLLFPRSLLIKSGPSEQWPSVRLVKPR